MTPNEYTQQALRTLSDTFNVVDVLDYQMEYVLTEAIYNGGLLDELKKNIFAEKPIELLDTIMPHGDDRPFPWEQVEQDITHGIIGIASEASELVEHLYRAMEPEGSINTVAVSKEIGDVLWYVALLCNAIGVPMDQIMAENIDKLRRRFPDKYEHSIAQTHDGT